MHDLTRVFNENRDLVMSSSSTAYYEALKKSREFIILINVILHQLQRSGFTVLILMIEFSRYKVTLLLIY